MFPLFRQNLCISHCISELAKCSSENNIDVSSIESAVCAIKWGHAMAGIDACPVSFPLVKLALEGAKRRLARPVQPKEIHTGWRCESTKHRYIKHGLS